MLDTTLGKKVTLTFTSTIPKLTLTQVWQARLSVGPMELVTTIVNNTGNEVTYHHSDVVAADLTVTSDNDVKLTRFNRSSVKGGDPQFDTGVFKSLMQDIIYVPSEVSNAWQSGPYVLPYTLLEDRYGEE